MNYKIQGKTYPEITKTVEYILSFQGWLDMRGGAMLEYSIYDTGQISFNIIAPRGMSAQEAMTQFDKEYETYVRGLKT